MQCTTRVSCQHKYLTVSADLDVADDAAFVEEGIGPAQSPLVAVSFQRNVHRKEKYLEAEPKALGVPRVSVCVSLSNYTFRELWLLNVNSPVCCPQITQIGLSVFQNSCVAVLLSKGLSHGPIGIPFFISSLTVNTWSTPTLFLRSTVVHSNVVFKGIVQ